MPEKEAKKSDLKPNKEDRLRYLSSTAHRAFYAKNSAELSRIGYEMLSIDPDFADAYQWLGIANHASDPIAAENHYRNAIMLDPKMSYAYSSLGMLIYRNESRSCEARGYFEKAIELDRNDPKAYLGLGWIKNTDGSSLNDAEECYRMAISLNQADSWAYSGLGWVLIKDKFRWGEAEENFLKALELNPDNMNAYEGLGYIYAKNENRLREAEENFLRVIKSDPNNAVIYLRLGYLYHSQNNIDKAIDACQKAALLDESNFNPLLVLASIYRNNGFEDESKKYAKLGEAIIKTKDFEARQEDHYNLACLHSILGNTNDAIKFLESAINQHEDFRRQAKSDPDFDFIRKTPKFLKLIKSK